MKSVHLIIYGKVQGVYYRQSACGIAKQLGISGTVRNCIDGSVEVFAEGEESKMAEFLEWCRKGPKPARVDRIDINDEALKNFRGFVIIR